MLTTTSWKSLSACAVSACPRSRPEGRAGPATRRTGPGGPPPGLRLIEGVEDLGGCKRPPGLALSRTGVELLFRFADRWVDGDRK